MPQQQSHQAATLPQPFQFVPQHQAILSHIMAHTKHVLADADRILKPLIILKTNVMKICKCIVSYASEIKVGFIYLNKEKES